MSIFTVVQLHASGPNGTLRASIEKNVTNYEVTNSVWLVAFDGTAHSLCEHLGISDAVMGTGVVTEVASYYGRANPAVWTWIKNNWDNSENG